MGRFFWSYVHECIVHPGLWWVGFEGSPLRDLMIEFHAATAKWAWPNDPGQAKMEPITVPAEVQAAVPAATAAKPAAAKAS